MPRPPDISNAALGKLRKCRADLQPHVEENLTIKDTLSALLEGVVDDDGSLPPGVQDAVLQELGEANNTRRPKRP